MGKGWTVFGERLETELERRKISYKEFAEKTGITPVTASRYVRCERIPGADMVRKVADVLGVRCDYLLGLTDNPNGTGARAAGAGKAPPDTAEDVWVQNAAGGDTCRKMGGQMGDCISREDVLDMLDTIESEIAEGLGLQYEKWRKYISDVPSPDQDPGEWIYNENGSGPDAPAWTCSNCRQDNAQIPTSILYPAGAKRILNPYAWPGSRYCPNCGKRMGGKDKTRQKI